MRNMKTIAICALVTAISLAPFGVSANEEDDAIREQMERENPILSLADVLASEQFCGLNYNTAAVQIFIDKLNTPDDPDFTSILQTLTRSARIDNEKMTPSDKTAQCTQV